MTIEVSDGSELHVTLGEVPTVLAFPVTGPTGPPGPVGGEPYRHDQTLAQAVFPIDHNLGRYPAVVSLHSLDLSEQYGQFQVQHVDMNRLLISMDQPTPVTALIL